MDQVTNLDYIHDSDQETNSVYMHKLFGEQIQCVDETIVIPRVPEHLKMVNPNSYTPLISNIGMYRNHARDNACQADNCRFEISRAYLGVVGITDQSWNQFCNSVVGDVRRIQQIYVDAIPIPIREGCCPKAISYKLTADAIFQVGFILGLGLPCNGSKQQNDSTGTNHFQVVMRKPVFRCRATEILSDFCLLENQLPLFLLGRVVSRLEKAPKFAGIGLSQVVEMFIYQFCLILPGDLEKKMKYNALDFHTCNHILDCLYTSLCHRAPMSNPTSSRDPIDMLPIHVLHAPRQPFAPISLPDGTTRSKLVNFVKTKLLALSSRLKPKNTTTRRNLVSEDIPTVTQLKKAGIRVVVGGSGITDVQFQNGILNLPRLSLDDRTSMLFRNLATYEYVMKSVPHLLSYLSLMDCLIDTEADVGMLRREGVIDCNGLGSDSDAAAMWNKLLRGYKFCLSPDYASVMVAINKHCQLWWIELYVEFMDTYFSRPWLTISLTAASILVILTFLQTVYAILAYY